MRAKQALTRLIFTETLKPLLKPSHYIPTSKQCPSNIKIRTMSFSEVEQTRSTWAVDENWSTAEGGLIPNYNQDNDGFYFLELDGKNIASISMITYKDLNMAFVGFFITRKPHRGQGYGRILMDELLDYTENNRGIKSFGLDCVPAHAPLYEKFGFKTYGQDDFWELKLDSKNVPEENFVDKTYPDTTSLEGSLFKYDASVYGASRPNFMKALCMKPLTYTLVYESDGVVRGYGVLNTRIPAKEEPTPSYRIGPFYADNEDVAASILQGLILSAPVVPSTIHLESPKSNPSAAKLLTQFGFANTFTASRMYRGEPPKQEESKIYGLSSVAFG